MLTKATSTSVSEPIHCRGDSISGVVDTCVVLTLIFMPYNVKTLKNRQIQLDFTVHIFLWKRSCYKQWTYFKLYLGSFDQERLFVSLKANVTPPLFIEVHVKLGTWASCFMCILYCKIHITSFELEVNECDMNRKCRVPCNSS